MKLLKVLMYPRFTPSVVHEPARAESRPRLELARLVTPLGSRARARLEPPRIRQERAKRLESGVELARGPLSEPTRAANGLESAHRPLFEPPRAGCQETRAWLESAQLVHNTTHSSKPLTHFSHPLSICKPPAPVLTRVHSPPESSV